MKTRFVVAAICALSLVLGGCTPGVPVPTALPDPRVIFHWDRPFPGQIVPLGNHVLPEVQVETLGATVAGVVFMVNGSQAAVARITVDGAFDADWLPGAAGEYYLQARATLSDGSAAVSEPSRICVVPFSGAHPIFPEFTRGYLGPCPIPTQIPNHTGVVLVSAEVGPRYVHFVLAPGCYTVAPTVTFVAYVDDPQNLVALVSARIPAGGGFLVDATRILNWTTTRGEGQKEYRGTFPLYPAAAMETALDTPSSMHWLVDAWGRDGSLLGSTNGFLRYVRNQCRYNLLVIGPSATPEVLEIFPSETPTPQPAPLGPLTFTFSKNAFCRKGPDTSFPDVTAIVKGDTVDILNVSEDGFWYYVFWKKFDAKCWVATGTGVATGDVSGLKVLVGPELPKLGVPPAGKAPSPAPPPCNPLIKACP